MVNGKWTWKVTITRLDKSKYQHSEQHEQRPRRGDIVETVVEGRLVKAEVELFHLEKLVVGPSGVRSVQATEI